MVLFDLNGTLTDPSALGTPWQTPDLGGEALAAAIQSAMVDTILGRFREFREHVDRILGVDAVRAFKPHPSTYAYALDELAVAPGGVTFVAAHAWDLAGAARAGMRTALVRRAGGSPPVYPRPDIEADDLTGIAAAIAGPA